MKGLLVEIRSASDGLFRVFADTGRKQFESDEMDLEKCEKLAKQIRDHIGKTCGVEFSVVMPKGGSA